MVDVLNCNPLGIECQHIETADCRGVIWCTGGAGDKADKGQVFMQGQYILQSCLSLGHTTHANTALAINSSGNFRFIRQNSIFIIK